MPRKRSKARTITIASLLVLLVFFLSIFLFRFQQTALLEVSPAKVDFFSSGSDLKCGTSDDKGVLVTDELGCSSIDFTRDACDLELNCPSKVTSPFFIVQGIQYSSKEGEIKCETPDDVLLLKNIPLIRPTERNIQQFPSEDEFLNRYNAYYDCGPFVIVNDKLYSYQTIGESLPRADIPFIVPPQSNVAHIELLATYCWDDKCPDCDKPKYSCNQIQEGIAENIFQGEKQDIGDDVVKIASPKINETLLIIKVRVIKEKLTLWDIIKLFFEKLFSGV